MSNFGFCLILFASLSIAFHNKYLYNNNINCFLYTEIVYSLAIYKKLQTFWHTESFELEEQTGIR